MQIHPVRESDRAEWLRMRCALWPGHDAAHAEEIDRFYSESLPEPLAVFLAPHCLPKRRSFFIDDSANQAYIMNCKRLSRWIR